MKSVDTILNLSQLPISYNRRKVRGENFVALAKTITMKILQKLGLVLAVVLAAVVITRLVLQWAFAHNQGLISMENVLFALILPVILVFWKPHTTFTSLAMSAAGYTVALTLIDYILVRQGDGFGGMIW